MTEDTFRHKGLRGRLLQEIKAKGITDTKVLEAIGKVPRHLFMDRSFIRQAYQDQAFPIGEGQTISQPYTVAFQSQLLKIEAGDRVLEVGTGSGYQAAILHEMGAKVFTIERHKTLFLKTSNLLTHLGYKTIKLFLGDGYEGLPDLAPFDKILVTAGAARLPETLLMQLRPGGLMVVPLGSKMQVMTRVKRVDEDNFEKETFGEFAFVPMLPGLVK